MSGSKSASETYQMSAEHKIVQYFLEVLKNHTCNIETYLKIEYMFYNRALAIKYLSAPPATVFQKGYFQPWA